MQITPTTIALTCHEINRTYCELLGDFSQPAWHEAPKWQKDSAIAGVKFQLENPTAHPSASHDSWLKEKAATGWKYGPVKNPARKEHPCFVPYEQLPDEQKIKDHLFKSIVAVFAPFMKKQEGSK